MQKSQSRKSRNLNVHSGRETSSPHSIVKTVSRETKTKPKTTTATKINTLKATENIIKLYKNSDNENSSRFLDKNSKSQENVDRCSSSFVRQ